MPVSNTFYIITVLNTMPTPEYICMMFELMSFMRQFWHL